MAVSEANLQRELPYRLQSSSARSLRRDGKPGTCRRRWLISTTTSRRASRNCVFRSAIAGRSAPPICWNGCSVRSAGAPKACPREGGGHPACLWRACGPEVDYAALIRAAERWRGIRITEFEQRQLRAIREEIDKDFAARNAPAAAAPQSHLSSNQRT